MSAAAEFSIPVRVYIEDTDAGGIVYYVNYLKFMERARTEFMRKLGYGKTAIFDDEAMFVVHSSNINHLDSAVLDDELEVTARPIKAGRTYIVFEQLVRRGSDVLCRADIKIACVHRRLRQPQAMPANMYDHIHSLLT